MITPTETKAIAALRSQLAARSVAAKQKCADMVERCEHHGTWRPYSVDADGTLRVQPCCPACGREHSLSLIASSSEIPARFATATFDSFVCASVRQREVLDEIVRYAQGVSRREITDGLLLRGSTGTGKSHLAIALLLRCRAAGLSGLYLRASDFMDRLRASAVSASDVLDRLAAVDVLVIDDMGKSLGTDFERSCAFNLLDKRWLQMRPTVITTNEPIDAARDLLTPAGFDRLTGAGAGVVELSWPSYRRAIRLVSG